MAIFTKTTVQTTKVNMGCFELLNKKIINKEPKKKIHNQPLYCYTSLNKLSDGQRPRQTDNKAIS